DRVRAGWNVDVTDSNRPRTLERRRLVGARTPDARVGDERAEDLPPAHRRPAVDDRQIRTGDRGVNALVWRDASGPADPPAILRADAHMRHPRRGREITGGAERRRATRNCNHDDGPAQGSTSFHGILESFTRRRGRRGTDLIL